MFVFAQHSFYFGGVPAIVIPSDVSVFINQHEKVFVIEQNRDAQLKSLLMIELQADPHKLISVLNYDGMPITADCILTNMKKTLSHSKSTVKA